MNPLHLPDQIDCMAKRQNNEKLAFVMSGLTVALLCVMALKECRSLFREERGRGR